MKVLCTILNKQTSKNGYLLSCYATPLFCLSWGMKNDCFSILCFCHATPLNSGRIHYGTKIIILKIFHNKNDKFVKILNQFPFT